jgi:hypothetical protein
MHTCIAVKAVMSLKNDRQTQPREIARDYILLLLFTGLRRNDVTAGYVVADVERLRKPMERIADFVLKAGGMRKSADVVRLLKRVGERT